MAAQAADALILVNGGVTDALNAISSEINATSLTVLNALNNALADANALAGATGDISAKVNAVTAELANLRSALSAAPGTADSWDKWVYLVRSQLQVDVQFSAETDQLASIKTLWGAIPNAAGYSAGTTFNGLSAPTWQDSQDLFNDTDFDQVISAYKLAQDLAKDFSDYRDDKYADYRTAYRNILKFETAMLYLDDGFNFAEFKDDYKSNVDKLDNVITLLESVKLESQYQAQLISLQADKQRVDAIVNHNAAVVSFFQGRLSDANTALADLNTQLAGEYTITINYFLGLSKT